MLLIAFALCGCEYFSGSTAGKIIPPPEDPLLFAGDWGSVQIASNAIVIDGNYWEAPSYRIKRVDAKSYMDVKNIDASAIPAYGLETVDVITVFAAGSYLGEFMIIDESAMLFFVQNNELFLKKIAGQASTEPPETYLKPEGPGEAAKETTSGALIGIRSKTQQGGFSYRTLWIAASAGGVRQILESEHLFFPRMSGFWECVSIDSFTNGTFSNVLIANGAFAKASDEKEAISMDAIWYIGNDYVSVESTAGGVSQLHVTPVDSLPSHVKIKVADMLGENGRAAYANARGETIESLAGKDAIVVAPDNYGENFGLTRERGHWKLVGRVNYKDAVQGFCHVDFDLKTIPPHMLVFYDNLALNWNRVKDRVPDALDAFTSPDKNIALVQTKNKLIVYTIGNEQLSASPIGEIELAEEETIVMAEWATSKYVDSWEKAFAAYGAHAQPPYR